MSHSDSDGLNSIYRVCHSVLGEAAWSRVLSAVADTQNVAEFPEALASLQASLAVPDFLPDLARVEWARRSAETSPIAATEAERFELNPSLRVLRLDWPVVDMANAEGEFARAPMRPGEQWALAWRSPVSGETRLEPASDTDLFALKVVAEDMSLEEAAAEGSMTLDAVHAAMRRSVNRGILLGPRSRLRRDPDVFPLGDTPDEFTSVRAFTLQWHITHACDLHCKHCYDRSKRSPLTLEQGLNVLAELGQFCRSRNVTGHVCFTGGNPFLSPHFLALCQDAAARGFSTSILGNPTPREQVEQVVAIQMPDYLQVSLEGLPAHNDAMRGDGHFARVIEFLGVLRDVEVPSAVMLTLTRDNLDEVLPLAERLRGHTDHFTFNRLSQVGEGADLALPPPTDYEAFLEAYVDAAQRNPIMGYKDNLINIVRRRRDLHLFDGCTGYGCGAAFSFLAVLPDGEAHACRKFPSPLGNVLRESLAELYDSLQAQRYRAGAAECAACPIRPRCGGCLAIAHAHGVDITRQKDPFCFMAGSGASPKPG